MVGKRLIVVAAITLAAAFAADAAAQTFKVTPQEKFDAPLSELLYGNFIELGYGIQTEPMRAEMLFNRSFEPFAPYKVVNKLWYDLYFDERDLSKGYERDWSSFDWYHSGYQHNEWYAAPGTPTPPSVIDDESTFFRTSTPDVKVTVQMRDGGSGHGRQYITVANAEPELWGGVAQDGKLFRRGESYRFSGRLRAEGSPAQAEVRFYREGDWSQPLAVVPLGVIGTGGFEVKEVVYEGNQYDGYVTFALWVAPGCTVSMDDFSLVPTDTCHGWRRDVVEVMKELKPRILRFPGGCFASFYDWREGIGPHSERVPQDSYFWGGQNYNDVGTAEFAMLCNAVGAEKQLCVNVYHSSKRRFEIDFPDGQAETGRNLPKFMSLTEGARSAADWVAYCNLPAGTHPMADLRASHGYPEPFGVKFWELDNEVHRWFEAEDYAWATVVYSKAMKAVDPTIKIGMSAYGDRPAMSDYHRDMEKMLEIAGPYIDFLADRGDADKVTRMMVGKVREYNRTHGTDIKYSDTEWLAYSTETKRDAYNMARNENGVTKSYAFSKWLYGLNLLKNFMSFQRMGPEMWFVNFNNLANTHSQSAIETPKESPFLTASGQALRLLSESPAARLLEMEGYEPKADDEYQVQAAWDAERQRLVLFVLNRTAEGRRPAFDLSPLGRAFRSCTVTELTAPSPVSMNTMDRPDGIVRTERTAKPNIKKGAYSIKVPAWSFTQLVLE